MTHDTVLVALQSSRMLVGEVEEVVKHNEFLEFEKTVSQTKTIFEVKAEKSHYV